MPAMRVDHEVLQDAVVVHTEGKVDSNSVEELISYLMTALSLASSYPARLLVVDLRDVTDFATAGIKAVLSCHQRALAKATAMRVVAANAIVVRPIKALKLDTILQLYPTLSAALLPSETKELPSVDDG